MFHPLIPNKEKKTCWAPAAGFSRFFAVFPRPGLFHFGFVIAALDLHQLCPTSGLVQALGAQRAPCHRNLELVGPLRALRIPDNWPGQGDLLMDSCFLEMLRFKSFNIFQPWDKATPWLYVDWYCSSLSVSSYRIPFKPPKTGKSTGLSPTQTPGSSIAVHICTGQRHLLWPRDVALMSLCRETVPKHTRRSVCLFVCLFALLVCLFLCLRLE